MRRFVRTLMAGVAATAIAAASGAAFAQHERQRQTLFIGLDTSGSFKGGGYDDAMLFLAYYIYGHLNGLGGLSVPRDLFVATIGGKNNDEPKAFHPIHDFAGKSIARLEADLRQWYPAASDTLTDFNAFFRQVARIAKERNLQLTPIGITMVTDGVPDIASIKSGSAEAYRRIDLTPLEYLSRSVTVRLAYTSPPVGERWRTLVPRQRVRLWTVDYEVMRGWRAQMRAQTDPADQQGLWKWVRENVDFRVRRGT